MAPALEGGEEDAVTIRPLRHTALAFAVALTLLLTWAVAFFMGVATISPLYSPVQHHSPINYGSDSRSWLGASATVPSSVNCVKKLHFGFYTSASRMWRNGNVVDVVRADNAGEVNCHTTGIRGTAHEAGSDPGNDYGPTYYGTKDKH